MDTLREICIKSIINNNIPYYNNLPEELVYEIFKTEVKNNCDNVVTLAIKAEESRDHHTFLGYEYGCIMGVNQCKDYVYHNMMIAEKYMKKGRYNVGHFGSIYPYIICVMNLIFIIGSFSNRAITLNTIKLATQMPCS